MFRNRAITICLFLTVFVAACSKSEGDGPAKKPSSEPSKKPEDTPSSKPTSASDAVSQLMGAYETCRASLAADKTDRIQACATAIRTAAEDAKGVVNDQALQHADAIASAARKLSESSQDLEAARLAFGNVSKAVLDLLSSQPEEAAKYHVFECPMAKGFKRWAQPSDKLDNPYMGTAMASCGSEVSMGEHGHMGSEHEGSNPLAREIATYEAAKPVFEEHCSSCHTKTDEPSKKQAKALKHFVMDGYPFGGHHADELGASIRRALGVEGDKATMPKDDPGAVKGDQLALIVAWSRAYDEAKAAGAGHHGTPADHHGGGHEHHAH